MQRVSKVLRYGVLIVMALAACGIFCKKSDLSEDEIKSELKKIVGDKGWKVAFFNNLKKDMKCEEVKKIYQDIQCEKNKDYSFPEVQIKDQKLFDGLKFTFTDNKLDSVTIMFKKDLDKALFKKISLDAFEAKWGKLDKEREEEILTWINDDYFDTQRNYMVDHYELSNKLPKE